MSENNSISKPSQFLSRRQFIHFSLSAVGAAWAGTLVQFRLFPSKTSTGSAEPVRFSLSELPIGGIKNINLGTTPVIVLRTPESIRAFSLICTHLGCLVEWQQNNEEFYCPCHDGRFDQFGEVTGGPPPIPLEQFPVRIEDEMVVVGET